MNYFIIATRSTESIYGFAAGILATDEATMNALKELKFRYDAIKQLDRLVGSVTYYDIPFSIDLLNDEFEGIKEDGSFQEVSDEDFDTFTNHDGNEYRVESPYIRVTESGFHVAWSSKWTSDEVWVEISWNVLGL